MLKKITSFYSNKGVLNLYASSAVSSIALDCEDSTTWNLLVNKNGLYRKNYGKTGYDYILRVAYQWLNNVNGSTVLPEHITKLALDIKMAIIQEYPEPEEL